MIVLPVPGSPTSRLMALAGSPPPRTASSGPCPLTSRSLAAQPQAQAAGIRSAPAGPGQSISAAAARVAFAGTHPPTFLASQPPLGAGDAPARHRLRERRPPGWRTERVGKVLRLVHHVIVGEFHNAHRVGGRAVVRDHALAHPQAPGASDPQDGEVPAGRMPAALRRDRVAPPEPFT